MLDIDNVFLLAKLIMYFAFGLALERGSKKSRQSASLAAFRMF